LPEFGVGWFFAPLGAKITVVKLVHFQRDPTAEVNAVGDMADWDLRFRQAAPNGVPHAAADRAVKLADRVAIGSETESENGHAEVFVVVGGVLTAEREEITAGKPEVRIEGREIMVHQTGGEIVVSSGDGSVRGENQTGGGQDAGFGEREKLRFHKGADALKGKESGVPFIHVKDGGAKAECFEGTNAADAKQDFLLDAHVEVAAVELPGDGTVLGKIGGEIGIEEIELDAADSSAPNTSDDFAIGKLNTDLNVGNVFDGENVEIILFESFLLPASRVEILTKIPFLIKKADANKREAQIAGGFEVIAGENAKSASENG
jgi:hypothetical protein